MPETEQIPFPCYLHISHFTAICLRPCGFSFSFIVFRIFIDNVDIFHFFLNCIDISGKMDRSAPNQINVNGIWFERNRKFVFVKIYTKNFEMFNDGFFWQLEGKIVRQSMISTINRYFRSSKLHEMWNHKDSVNENRLPKNIHLELWMSNQIITYPCTLWTTKNLNQYLKILSTLPKWYR